MPEVKRKFVVPGDVVAKGVHHRLGANVLKRGEDIVATRVGLAEIGDVIRVIPLSGPYIPKVDDFVVGKIIDYSAFTWEVDINSCFLAILPAQNVFGRQFSPTGESLSAKFDIGDLIGAKIQAFDRTRDPVLTLLGGHGLGKIDRGKVVKIQPSRVPRLIGKKGSMIRTIEEKTRCRLTVGQNGIVVVNGPPEGVLKAIKAIRLIEEEAHTADLTQRVQELLGKS
jgi:exosome complex component RRP4